MKTNLNLTKGNKIFKYNLLAGCFGFICVYAGIRWDSCEYATLIYNISINYTRYKFFFILYSGLMSLKDLSFSETSVYVSFSERPFVLQPYLLNSF